jgi:uncharacterized protein YdiU (UPF0061 family)
MIGAWNLSRLAESLLPLIDENREEAVRLAREEIASYWDRYNECWTDGMRAKLGIYGEEPEYSGLISDQLKHMKENGMDFTDTFRSLSPNNNPAVIPRNHHVEEALTAAENGDYTVMNELLAALRKPYEESAIYSQPPEASTCAYKTFCGT